MLIKLYYSWNCFDEVLIDFTAEDELEGSGRRSILVLDDLVDRFDDDGIGTSDDDGSTKDDDTSSEDSINSRRRRIKPDETTIGKLLNFDEVITR